jgi:hypothetical protein
VVFPPDAFPEEPPQADVASSPPAISTAPAACSVRFNVDSWYVIGSAGRGAVSAG